MGEIKITKEEVDKAITSINKLYQELENGIYDPGKIVVLEKSSGKSKNEIIKMFESVGQLQKTMLEGLSKTNNALTYIKDNFEGLDNQIASIFLSEK